MEFIEHLLHEEYGENLTPYFLEMKKLVAIIIGLFCIFIPQVCALEHPNNYRFTDQEQDSATNLYYYDARYYDPVLGRFISPDPLQQDISEMLKYGELNAYRYVLNNPVNFIDPLGAYTELIIKHQNPANWLFDKGHAILRINENFYDFYTQNKLTPFTWSDGIVDINDAQSHLNYYHSGEVEGATFSVFELNLDEQQEQNISAHIESLVEGGEVPEYNAYSNNCTDFIVEEALEQFTDIDIHWSTDTPHELENEMFENFKSGSNFINTIRGGFEQFYEWTEANLSLEKLHSAAEMREEIRKQRDEARGNGGVSW